MLGVGDLHPLGLGPRLGRSLTPLLRIEAEVRHLLTPPGGAIHLTPLLPVSHSKVAPASIG